ncbi:hypothetical protein [Paenibacillus brasilensis]|nr:hypothetical protein [Paenibacillus brasilensis]
MIDATIVRVHQHGSGAKGSKTSTIGRSHGGLSTKIYAVGCIRESTSIRIDRRRSSRLRSGL